MSEFLTGFQKCKIISINPDRDWLEQMLAIEENPIYIWTDRQNVKHCLLHIYFQDSKDNIFKSEIHLNNKFKQGKIENYLYVNQIGDNQWVTDENQLFSNFKNWEKIVSWGINGEKIEKYKVGAIPFEKEIIASTQFDEFKIQVE